MYIKKKYSTKMMINWTRRELRFFLVFSIIVTVLHEIFGLRWLQIPWTALALIGTAVAFMISFQSNAAYGRIWEARQIWGGIVNDSRMFAIMVRDMITNEYASDPASNEEIKEVKRQIIKRHIAWLTSLRHAMRQAKPWESYRQNRRNQEWLEKIHIPELESTLEEDLKEVLASSEYNYVLSKSNRQATVLSLQSKHLRQLKERGLIWEFSFLELESKLSDLMTHQGKSERIKNFPYPRQFATLGYDFVNLFILLLPFGIVPEFGSTAVELSEEFPIVGQYFIWFAIPFTTIVAWVFNTMQRIGTVGDNPFEGSANDVPISSMARAIEIDVLEIIDTPNEELPKPVPVVYDVQM